jgi:hypothetical protein
MKKQIAALLVAFGTMACAESLSARDTQRFATGEILKFEQIQGQSQWASNIKRRVQGTTWTFYADGTMQYAPADSRDDLFPVRGKYECSGHKCHFRAEASSRTGRTGSASVLIEGTVDFSQQRLEMTQINSMGNAAVINGTRFSQANASSYRFTVLLTQP